MFKKKVEQKDPIVSSIEDEIEVMMECMKALPRDSREYQICLSNYNNLLRARKEAKPIEGKKWYVFDKVSDKVILVVGEIILPAGLAVLSYTKDKELNICNGRIWNLAMKFLQNKKKV